jgi:hypothetical protein
MLRVRDGIRAHGNGLGWLRRHQGTSRCGPATTPPTGPSNRCGRHRPPQNVEKNSAGLSDTDRDKYGPPPQRPYGDAERPPRRHLDLLDPAVATRLAAVNDVAGAFFPPEDLACLPEEARKLDRPGLGGDAPIPDPADIAA